MDKNLGRSSTRTKMNLYTEKVIPPDDEANVLAPHQFVTFNHNRNTGFVTLGQDNALQYDMIRLDITMAWQLYIYLKEVYEQD